MSSSEVTEEPPIDKSINFAICAILQQYVALWCWQYSAIQVELLAVPLSSLHKSYLLILLADEICSTYDIPFLKYKTDVLWISVQLQKAF